MVDNVAGGTNATTQSFTPSTSITGNVDFTVTVTDNCGGTCSSTLSIFVNTAPTAFIVEGPAVQVCTPTTPLNAGTNAGSPTYQWKKNGVNISGATASSLTVSASGSYSVVISDGTCSSESAATVVTIVTPATTPIALTPSNINGCLNAVTSAAFTGTCFETITSTFSVTAPTDTTWASFMNGAMVLPVAGFPAGSVITNVSLTLGLAHDKAGELSVTLASPTSVAKLVFNGPATGLPSTFGTNGSVPTLPYTFTSASTAVIPTTGAIPSPGPYKAFDALTFFHALAPNGNWTLGLVDIGQPGGGGTVNNVSLTLTVVAPSGPVEWYDQSVGGTLLATTTSFTPGSIAGITSTSGVKNLYAQCGSSPIAGCPSSRVLVTFTVNDPNDGDPCTTDACDPLTGAVTNTPSCAAELTTVVLLEGYYSGGGTLTPGLVNIGANLNPDDVDQVTISAFDAGYPSGPNGTSPVDVQMDTVNILGSVTVTFAPAVLQGTSYYIKVNQRNHLETWSAAPVLLGTTTTYDFTSSPAQALFAIAALSGDGYAMMYTGDISQDNTVDATDFLLLDPEIQAGLFGYFSGDLNGDGSVDATDFLYLDPNIQLGIASGTP